MRKILNSNVFLTFVLVILLSIIGYILFDEYERNKNIKILNNLVKKEKDLQNVKAAYEALLKDMEEEENIKAKNDNSNSEINNSENDNKENNTPGNDDNNIINSENDNKEDKNPKDDNKENNTPENDNNIINSKDDSSDIINSKGDNKENISSEKEEKLANESDKKIISKSIDELNNIINENNAQIINIFHKEARLSKEDREKLEEISNKFSEVLDKYGAIYHQVSLRKKNSLEMEKGDTEKEK